MRTFPRSARPRFAVSVLPAVFLALASPRAGSAQNLAPNPDLDQEIAPWGGLTGQVSSWSSDDADACPLSGSFLAQAKVGTTASAAAMGAAEACIVVNEGDHLYQQVAYKSTAQTVTLNLVVYDNATCTGFVRGDGNPFVLPPSATWTTGGREVDFVGLTGPTSVFPSVRAADDTPTAFTLSVDRLFLGKADPIFRDDFEGGSPCRWSSFQPHP